MCCPTKWQQANKRGNVPNSLVLERSNDAQQHKRNKEDIRNLPALVGGDDACLERLVQHGVGALPHQRHRSYERRPNKPLAEGQLLQ